MIKKIDKNNPIFISEDFQKDKYLFNTILKNLSSNGLELYSDEENYILCRGRKDLQTWIWTKDNFDKSLLMEIEKLINVYLTDNDKDKFTCKQELYQLLKYDNFTLLNDEDYFEMSFMMCRETHPTKRCDGNIYVPNIYDIETLSDYYYDYSIKNGKDKITKTEAFFRTRTLVEENRIYAWKNSQGKIVSMASFSIIDNQAKLSNVYTITSERRKGYARNLIYLLTEELIKEQFIPVMYINNNTLPSTKLYLRIGYEKCGVLVNFSCSKNKIKKM